MTSQEALEIVEQILPPGTLTDVKTLVFQQSWDGKEYTAIARELGYNDSYIRDAGAELWRSLSEVLCEPVKKKNFRSLLKQRFGNLSSLPKQSFMERNQSHYLFSDESGITISETDENCEAEIYSQLCCQQA